MNDYTVWLIYLPEVWHL